MFKPGDLVKTKINAILLSKKYVLKNYNDKFCYENYFTKKNTILFLLNYKSYIDYGDNFLDITIIFSEVLYKNKFYFISSNLIESI